MAGSVEVAGGGGSEREASAASMWSRMLTLCCSRSSRDNNVGPPSLQPLFDHKCFLG